MGHGKEVAPSEQHQPPHPPKPLQLAGGSRQPWWRCRLARPPLRAGLASVVCPVWAFEEGVGCLAAPRWTGGGHGGCRWVLSSWLYGRDLHSLTLSFRAVKDPGRPGAWEARGELAWIAPQPPFRWPKIGIPPTRNGVALRTPSRRDPGVRTGPRGPTDAARSAAPIKRLGRARVRAAGAGRPAYRRG